MAVHNGILFVDMFIAYLSYKCPSGSLLWHCLPLLHNLLQQSSITQLIHYTEEYPPCVVESVPKRFFFSLQSLSFCLDNSLAGDQESSKLPTWACPLKYKLFQVRSALVIGAYVCTILIFYCWPLDLLSDCLFHTVGTSKEEQRGHV